MTLRIAILSLVFLFSLPFQSFGEESKCIEGDCQNGFGTRNDYGEQKYTGFFKDGMYDGKGIITHAHGYFEGEFRDNQPNGHGKLVNKDMNINPDISEPEEPAESIELYFEGNFKNGLPDGYCELKFSDGSGYKGQWKEGEYDGEGEYVDENGVVRKGKWAKGEFLD